MKALCSLLTLALLALIGCQTFPIEEFDGVTPGMSKAAVLGAVGAPARTRRWQGKDRWTYVYRTRGGEKIRDVHFEEGKVVYAGVPPLPPVSASEQDRLNETLNVREDARLRVELEADRMSGKRLPDPPPEPPKSAPAQ